jgi:nitrate reductase NapE component
MGVLDDISVFTAYLYDTANHLAGGSSHLAASLAIQADPALEAIAQPGWDGAPTTDAGQGLLSDVVASEVQQLNADQNKAQENAKRALQISKVAVVAILAIAAVGAIGYTVRAFR